LLAVEHRSCVVRGSFVGHAEARLRVEGHTSNKVRRLKVLFEDVPRYWMMIDVDKFSYVDAAQNALPAIDSYLQLLPDAFHDITFYWQLSNSAGSKKNKDTLKAHLWFWLSEPASAAQLKAWAKTCPIELDTSVFNPIQEHFTADPVFEPGILDPIKQRSGLVRGIHGDELALDLDPGIEPQDSLADLGEVPLNAAVKDPVAQMLSARNAIKETQSRGWLVVQCPRHEQHTEPDAPGSTATVYIPGHDEMHGRFICLHGHCQGISQGEFLKALGVPPSILVKRLPASAFDQQLPELAIYRESKRGLKEVTYANLVTSLCNEAAFKLRYDSFNDTIEWRPLNNGVGVWRELDLDHDLTAIAASLERDKEYESMKRATLREVVRHAASRSTYDWAQDWLNSLVWDGRERIAEFFHSYADTEPTNYARALGRYTWTALAGRVLVPGIQADMVPILVGEQGVGKTSLFRNIVPDERYFGEVDLAAPQAEKGRALVGKLVVELGELRGLRHATLENIKQWITNKSDEWTKKFHESRFRNPRRCLIVGTTNDSEFLADPTGERRWLPITVGRLDVEAAERDREQLWAEAREAFAVKGIDYGEAERLARFEHFKYEDYDPLRERLAAWLSAGEQFSEIRSPDLDNGYTYSQLMIAMCLDGAAAHTAKTRLRRALYALGWAPVKRRGELRWYSIGDLDPEKLFV